jgi:chromosome partitioning protein
MKTTVISVLSIKGGTGKTNLAVQLANCLGAAEKSVCFIDADYTDAGSKFYLTERTAKLANEKNIYEALQNANNNLAEYMLETDRKGVRFIPSSRYVDKLSNTPDIKLKDVLSSLAGMYDFVIIDSPPHYDNLMLNIINVSDYIITPVMLNLDNYNAAQTLKGKIELETDKIDNWFLSIIGFDRRYIDSKTGTQKSYIDFFLQEFANFTPVQTWFPFTRDIIRLKDYKMFLTDKKDIQVQNCICNPPLYDAVCNLADCFIDEADTFIHPEYF